MLSDLGYDLQRRCQCKSCKNPIPDTAPLHKRYCQALCRANAWSRANRQFSSALTVSDFENVREAIKQFEVRLKKRVLGYALIKAHPKFDLVAKIGKSTFPPPGRKTKRSPDETGKVCFSSAPFFSFAPWFEWPRVPVVGHYQVVLWCEGDAAPIMSGLHVEVRKAFPAVHFHDDKTGQRYTLKGDLIQAKPPKPPKPPTERKKRKPATAIGPRPERALTTERASELVPAMAAQRAPDAELVARVEKLEEERAGQTKERADLLATIEKERKEHAAVRQDLEQKLRLAKSMPKPPAKDDSSSRLQAAENRALGDKLKKLEESLSELQGRVKELEQGNASLTQDRDELRATVANQKVGHATLAKEIITLEERAKAAERDRTELATKLTEAERQRDELAAKPAHQTAPAATAEAVMAGDGADSTPPTSPTGIVIPRLALGGNLPLASSPKTGPPSLGIFGQNHRPPLRGSANRKHKR